MHLSVNQYGSKSVNTGITQHPPLYLSTTTSHSGETLIKNYLVKITFTRQKWPLNPLRKIWGNIPIEMSGKGPEVSYLCFQWLPVLEDLHSNPAGTGCVVNWHSFIQPALYECVYPTVKTCCCESPLKKNASPFVVSFPVSKHRQESWTPYGLLLT